jgi:hypothetical protein
MHCWLVLRSVRVFQALVLVRPRACQSMAGYSWAVVADGVVCLCDVLRRAHADAVRWQVFSYLVLGFSGLVLVLQPVPGWSGRVREAHP